LTSKKLNQPQIDCAGTITTQPINVNDHFGVCVSHFNSFIHTIYYTLECFKDLHRLVKCQPFHDEWFERSDRSLIFAQKNSLRWQKAFEWAKDCTQNSRVSTWGIKKWWMCLMHNVSVQPLFNSNQWTNQFAVFEFFCKLNRW